MIGFFFGFYSEGLDRLSVPHLIEKFNLPDLGEGTMVGWFGGLSAICKPDALILFSFIIDWSLTLTHISFI
ncbi:MAG: hypothetical protein CVU41_15300 [Chloroflexi bacterium HGW-Chloroflexi-3]|nr:MAG: hypothetical protein CVU41_15300 [Chloroflexi bacterium HGW-Chloroflexi-3]